MPINLSELLQPVQRTLDAIYTYYETQEANPRGHLGASKIGDKCDRHLWYLFRWAWSYDFVRSHKAWKSDDQERAGRKLRLFKRGHNEELSFIEDFRKIGIEVREIDERTGKQYRFVEHGGHFQGSIDGMGLGFLEAPVKWHLLEFKTSNQKRFERFIPPPGSKQAAGKVKEVEPTHYAQMQVYMHYMTLERAFYWCVNKNDDRIYSERVHYDHKAAIYYIQRARRLITADAPPPRISDKPTHWECKLCDDYPVCHGSKLPAVNCHTCAHATPALDGEPTEAMLDAKQGGVWLCSKWNDSPIPFAVQTAGCDDHVYIPGLLDRLAEPVDAEPLKWVEYQAPNGQRFRNGEGGLTSQQIKAWEG